MLYREENGDRIYDGLKYNVLDITYSEIKIHFEQYLATGAKIFYLKGSSKLQVSLSESKLTYLKTLDIRFKEPIFYIFSKTINNIKLNQCSDLFFLTNLKKIEFACLLPRLAKKNCFYFDLLICINNGLI